MKIKQIGEFGLIEQIKKTIKNSSSVIQGIGDDCAVVKFNQSQYMLLTCDMLIEDVDFTKRTNPYLLGRKAIGCSISDIASKGGVPKYALVALGLSSSCKVQFVRELYRGISYWAKKYKIDIVGGDISRSKKVIIDISMQGLVDKSHLVLRSQAKSGDLIFVTGSLGEKHKHLNFKPRLEEAQYLVKNYQINAMIDVSDGLTLDLSRLLSSSGTGATLYEKLIPLAKGCKDIKKALSSGEEFELLFTLSVKEAKKLLASKRSIYSAIGEVTKERNILRLITKDRKEKVLNPKGYRHF